MNLFWEQKDDPNIDGPQEGWSSTDIFWVGPGDIELNTVLYASLNPSDVAASRYLVTGSGTGVLGSYIEYDVANRWTNVSVLPDGYKLIKTDANGVVTEFIQMNQIANPPCN